MKAWRYFRKHPEEAEAYAYKEVNGKKTKHADHEKIANKAYLTKNGNRKKREGEGYLYRGRGFIHITGQLEYEEFTKFHAIYWEHVDFLKSPDLVIEAKYSIRSAVYFWLKHKLYAIADEGDDGETVNAITRKINKYTKSYPHRRENFNVIKDNGVFKDAF